MTQRWRTLVLLAATVMAAFSACHAPAPSRFPHLQHLTGIECGGTGQPPCLSCASCHDASGEPGHSLAPDAQDCAPCHESAQNTLSGSLQARDHHAYRRAKLGFDHDAHLALAEVKGQCVTCHAGVVEDGVAANRMPSMDDCLKCHQDDFDRARCTPCHDGADLAQLVPKTFMRHDQRWQRAHGRAAAAQQATCQQCHSESQCADCHDQKQTLPLEARQPDAISSRQVHRADFLTRHAIEARSSGSACMKCHTPDTCDACHVRRGVSAASVGGVNPHPAGWLGRDTGSRDFHGRAARRNATNCAACHDHGPATNCIRCHQVGGPGGDPHPRGWHSSRSFDSVPCRYCHDS